MVTLYNWKFSELKVSKEGKRQLTSVNSSQLVKQLFEMEDFDCFGKIKPRRTLFEFVCLFKDNLPVSLYLFGNFKVAVWEDYQFRQTFLI